MDTDDNGKSATMVSLGGRPDQISEEDSAFTFKNNTNSLANQNCFNKMLFFETRISVGSQTSTVQPLALLIILTCEERRVWGNSRSPEQQQCQESLREPSASRSKIPRQQPKGVKTVQKA